MIAINNLVRVYDIFIYLIMQVQRFLDDCRILGWEEREC